MPVPKRRHSSSRRDKRRSHDALSEPAASYCPNCQEPKPPHRICKNCGYYKGKEVIKVAEAE
ncbi:MAG: 50S ribosomal protein L32 [Deltaproteobacteria bacterium ADurb.BinA179]|jgi:large subunit ribosomal protein L32|nr:50S ribosomal protein L32 [Deltaproteobacteria bacterium]MDI9543373.1 50S ribosomal protein L32 [Pseudomonadota bacterium]NLW66317.1 50S ribosomal protein L32 [Bacteriovoracaceae bacterium]OPZ27399.1 MAG: 50S ribosomal protein L32 [Deltaproteobacteria bacterium ADurb.BinA179]HRR21267.1 50S ribosomal protein L32 [Desulfomonilia bacterium]